MCTSQPFIIQKTLSVQKGAREATCLSSPIPMLYKNINPDNIKESIVINTYSRDKRKIKHNHYNNIPISVL